MDNENKLKGLGGWLILVGIGVVLGPFILMNEFYTIFLPIIQKGVIPVLLTEGTAHYNAQLGLLVLFEVLFSILMIIASFGLMYFYFTKHYRFPLLYIVIAIATVAFAVIDLWMTSIILPDEDVFKEETVIDIVKAFVAVCIWVPYMLVSKRVKLTFVEKKPVTFYRNDDGELTSSI